MTTFELKFLSNPPPPVLVVVWLMTQQLQSSVAFLPVNPNLSPLRNQGRQKLARLNSEDFAQLVVHILLDTKRRQQLSIQTGEFPVPCVYDSVYVG